MNRDRERKRKRFRLKILLIFEAVVCYMALLNIVSHMRVPQQYGPATDAPLVGVSDFIGFDGGGTEKGLLLENQTPGTAVGYQSELTLSGLDSIYLSFSVDCPAEYAGGLLTVDLYNYESNYDSMEQEYQISLKAGTNEVEFIFKPGEWAPEKAQLRIFTLDAADYEVRNFQAYQGTLLPKVSFAMIAVPVVCFAVLCLTGILYCHGGKVKNGRPVEDGI